MNSRNQFVPTAAAILAHNITLIMGILAAKVIPGLGILGPTIGVVAGAVLQIVLLLPGILATGAHLRLLVDLSDPYLHELVRLLIPNGLSVGVNYAGFILDTAYASQVANQGALAAIYNAWLLVGLPIALIGQAIGQAVFPRLAEFVESGRWKDMQKAFIRSLGAALILAVLALLSLLFLGRFTIHILFEHGKFDAVTGNLTFQVMTIYALGLPAYIATELVTRGLISLRDTRTPLLTNSVQILIRFIILALLIQRFAALTISIAFAISASLETIILASVMWRRLSRKMRTNPEKIETSAPV